MSEHTKEPWKIYDVRRFEDHDEVEVHCGEHGAAEFDNFDKAVRAVAEHNACLDIPTEALEAGAVKRLMDAAKGIKQPWPEPDLRDDSKEISWSAYKRLQEALAALKPEGE